MAIDVGWVDSVWVKIVAGCFAGLASVLTLHQVYQHLRHFKNRRLQKYVCRILLMVPIYALSSFLPLVVGDKSFVVEKVKDCYEAFLIYTFLAYIFALLGEESDIVGRIQVRVPVLLAQSVVAALHVARTTTLGVSSSRPFYQCDRISVGHLYY